MQGMTSRTVTFHLREIQTPLYTLAKKAREELLEIIAVNNEQEEINVVEQEVPAEETPESISEDESEQSSLPDIFECH